MQPQRPFHYGERLRLPVKLKLPRNFRNPGAFDYQAYLTANDISALGSAKAEDVQLTPRLQRQPHRTLANPHSRQHHRQSARALASAPGRAHRCNGHRRRSLHRPRYPPRFPALRHLSHSRGLRNERNHPGLRRLLDSAPLASRGSSRNPDNDFFLRGIRLSNRSRSPSLASHTNVRHLSRNPPALPRPRHGQRARSSRSRVTRLRSPPALHRQFPDDISMRPHCRCDRPPAHRTHLTPLPPSAHALGRRRLRSVAASASSPVPPRSAAARQTTSALHRRPMVAAPHAHRDHHLPCRVRAAAGLSSNADGISPPHGILLSPRHDDRPSRERGRSSA